MQNNQADFNLAKAVNGTATISLRIDPTQNSKLAYLLHGFSQQQQNDDRIEHFIKSHKGAELEHVVREQFNPNIFNGIIAPSYYSMFIYDSIMTLGFIAHSPGIPSTEMNFWPASSSSSTSRRPGPQMDTSGCLHLFVFLSTGDTVGQHAHDS